MGPGTNRTVDALIDYKGKLIAGGSFDTAGGIAANSIAAWDGNTWSPLGPGMDYWVSALTIYDGKLIAGGFFDSIGGVAVNHIAAWDGSSWSPLGFGMNSSVECFAVFGDKLFAAGHFQIAGGVSAKYIAMWDGTSWSSVASPNGYIHSMAVYAGRLIVGGGFDTIIGGIEANGIAALDTEGGIFWSSLGSGTNGRVRALSVFNDTLIVGGSFNIAGGKISAFLAKWSKRISTDIDDENPILLPEDYELSQNYPNPFNPTTTIEYALPYRTYVKIEIFNLLGQRIRTLVDEIQSAGRYQVYWDGTNDKGNVLSTGTYFYRLRGDDFVTSKKMLLLK